jgi:hypothetical protein
MPMVTQCTALGCETLTMGPLCVAHDLPVERTFVRGRPFARKPVEWRFTPQTRRVGPVLRRASEPVVAARSLR